MRRSKLVKLTVLPALATACATAPIQDEEMIEGGMSGDAYRADLGVAFEGEDPSAYDNSLPDGGYPDETERYYAHAGYGSGGFWPRVSGRPAPARGGFGGFFSAGGGGFHGGGSSVSVGG
jgi:hypothetical protein